MHIMSVSSGSCLILFKVLTLNAAICIVCLHFSSFCCLSSVADFSKNLSRTRLFFVVNKLKSLLLGTKVKINTSS